MCISYMESICLTADTPYHIGRQSMWLEKVTEKDNGRVAMKMYEDEVEGNNYVYK